MQIYRQAIAAWSAVTLALMIMAVASSAAQANDFPVPGSYDLMGRNPDGSRYDGWVKVEAQGPNSFKVTWTTPQVYTGVGGVEDGRFVVDWGSSAPAIYTPTSVWGLIEGTWANGAGWEVWRLRR